eukprot:gene11461-12659_t
MQINKNIELQVGEKLVEQQSNKEKEEEKREKEGGGEDFDKMEERLRRLMKNEERKTNISKKEEEEKTKKKFGENCWYENKEVCKEIKEEKICKKVGCQLSHDESVTCRWRKNCFKGDQCKFLHKEEDKHSKRLRSMDENRKEQELKEISRGERQTRHEIDSTYKQKQK